MPDLALAPLAREDLKEIGRYTQKTWGISQRNKYLEDFARTFDKIQAGVTIGRKRSEIMENLLCHPCNKHMVFFRRDDLGHVEILRILHARMDFERHF